MANQITSQASVTVYKSTFIQLYVGDYGIPGTYYGIHVADCDIDAERSAVSYEDCFSSFGYTFSKTINFIIVPVLLRIDENWSQI